MEGTARLLITLHLLTYLIFSQSNQTDYQVLEEFLLVKVLAGSNWYLSFLKGKRSTFCRTTCFTVEFLISAEFLIPRSRDSPALKI